MSAIEITRANGERLATVTVADSAVRAARGLSFRAPIAADAGMWFPTVASIHMMGMRFPLDVLFMGPAADDTREILSIARGVRPWIGLAAYRGADGCLELVAGTADTLRVGERLGFRAV